jgi:lipopolysaccharide transport system ATP-binding protein
LSGKENIYLNGAILGMSRGEIRRKFDDIVAFANVEKFIDTPVKHYSSGMYMRLAVSVSAHLDPGILLIDEVLAVGDVEFQKKCLGKMREVSQSGRTVLFVSHNMAAITSFCQRGVFLKNGEVCYDGTASGAVARYTSDNLASLCTDWNGDAGDENVRLLRTSIQPIDASLGFDTGSPLQVSVEVDVKKPIHGLIVGFWLCSQFGSELAYVRYDDHLAPQDGPTPPGRIRAEFVIPPNTLGPGLYHVEFDVGIHMMKRIIFQEGTLLFELQNVTGIGRQFPLANGRGQTSLLRPAWSTYQRAD